MLNVDDPRVNGALGCFVHPPGAVTVPSPTVNNSNMSPSAAPDGSVIVTDPDVEKLAVPVRRVHDMVYSTYRQRPAFQFAVTMAFLTPSVMKAPRPDPMLRPDADPYDAHVVFAAIDAR